MTSSSHVVGLTDEDIYYIYSHLLYDVLPTNYLGPLMKYQWGLLCQKSVENQKECVDRFLFGDDSAMGFQKFEVHLGEFILQPCGRKLVSIGRLATVIPNPYKCDVRIKLTVGNESHIVYMNDYRERYFTGNGVIQLTESISHITPNSLIAVYVRRNGVYDVHKHIPTAKFLQQIEEGDITGWNYRLITWTLRRCLYFLERTKSGQLKAAWNEKYPNQEYNASETELFGDRFFYGDDKCFTQYLGCFELQSGQLTLIFKPTQEMQELDKEVKKQYPKKCRRIRVNENIVAVKSIISTGTNFTITLAQPLVSPPDNIIYEVYIRPLRIFNSNKNSLKGIAKKDKDRPIEDIITSGDIDTWDLSLVEWALEKSIHFKDNKTHSTSTSTSSRSTLLKKLLSNKNGDSILWLHERFWPLIKIRKMNKNEMEVAMNILRKFVIELNLNHNHHNNHDINNDVKELNNQICARKGIGVKIGTEVGIITSKDDDQVLFSFYNKLEKQHSTECNTNINSYSNDSSNYNSNSNSNDSSLNINVHRSDLMQTVKSFCDTHTVVKSVKLSPYPNPVTTTTMTTTTTTMLLVVIDVRTLSLRYFAHNVDKAATMNGCIRDLYNNVTSNCNSGSGSDCSDKGKLHRLRRGDETLTGLEAWRLVLRLFCQLKYEGKSPLVILLDGVDYLEDMKDGMSSSSYRIANMVADLGFDSAVPCWLKFIVTSRNSRLLDIRYRNRQSRSYSDNNNHDKNSNNDNNSNAAISPIAPIERPLGRRSMSLNALSRQSSSSSSATTDSSLGLGLHQVNLVEPVMSASMSASKPASVLYLEDYEKDVLTYIRHRISSFPAKLLKTESVAGDNLKLAALRVAFRQEQEKSYWPYLITAINTTDGRVLYEGKTLEEAVEYVAHVSRKNFLVARLYLDKFEDNDMRISETDDFEQLCRRKFPSFLQMGQLQYLLEFLLLSSECPLTLPQLIECMRLSTATSLNVPKEIELLDRFLSSEQLHDVPVIVDDQYLSPSQNLIREVVDEESIEIPFLDKLDWILALGRPLPDEYFSVDSLVWHSLLPGWNHPQVMDVLTTLNELQCFILEKTSSSGCHIRMKSSSIQTWLQSSECTLFSRPLEIRKQLGLDIQTGETALMRAIRDDKMSAFLLLLGGGVDIHVTDMEGRTALMIAAAEGRDEYMMYLLHTGLRIDDIDHCGRTVLMHAVLRRQFRTLRILTNLPVNLLDVQDNEGSTALILATTANDAKVVSLLLSRGANVLVMNQDGMNALHIACVSGFVSCVRRLLECEASVINNIINIPNNRGESPLILAAMTVYQSVEMLDVLIEKGAFIEAVTPDGCTALMKAAGAGSASSVEKLLLAG
eukprot:gene6024-12143_t